MAQRTPEFGVQSRKCRRTAMIGQSKDIVSFFSQRFKFAISSFVVSWFGHVTFVELFEFPPVWICWVLLSPSAHRLSAYYPVQLGILNFSLLPSHCDSVWSPNNTSSTSLINQPYLYYPLCLTNFSATLRAAQLQVRRSICRSSTPLSLHLQPLDLSSCTPGEFPGSSSG